MDRPNQAAERRRRVVESLTDHLQAPAAAELVRATGVRLREATIRDKTEHGVLIDVDARARIGDEVIGTARGVEGGPLVRAMQAGRRYCFLHTHPDGRSFSQEDITVLAAHWPLLWTVVAVGAQGIWYVMSVAQGDEAPPPEAVVRVAHQERDLLTQTYQDLVQSGAMTRRDAQRQLTHEIWQRSAATLGLRYDRV